MGKRKKKEREKEKGKGKGKGNRDELDPENGPLNRKTLKMDPENENDRAQRHPFSSSSTNFLPHLSLYVCPFSFQPLNLQHSGSAFYTAPYRSESGKQNIANHVLRYHDFPRYRYLHGRSSIRPEPG